MCNLTRVLKMCCEYPSLCIPVQATVPILFYLTNCSAFYPVSLAWAAGKSKLVPIPRFSVLIVFEILPNIVWSSKRMIYDEQLNTYIHFPGAHANRWVYASANYPT